MRATTRLNHKWFWWAGLILIGLGATWAFERWRDQQNNRMVVIPEGFTRFDVAQRLEARGVCSKHGFLRASEDATLLSELNISGISAEGYLFPATYRFRIAMTPEDVIRRMVKTWYARLSPLMFSYRREAQALFDMFHWGLSDITILASMVEKETHAPEERPQVAGVFINRLSSPTFVPKRLQSDPTVGYGCKVFPQVSAACQLFDGKRVTPQMTADSSNPYNTYRITGLPPGPIANPGIEAFRSVLAYARHGFFYFVARGDGRHTFSETFDAHKRALANGGR